MEGRCVGGRVCVAGGGDAVVDRGDGGALAFTVHLAKQERRE